MFYACSSVILWTCSLYGYTVFSVVRGTCGIDRLSPFTLPFTGCDDQIYSNISGRGGQQINAEDGIEIYFEDAVKVIMVKLVDELIGRDFTLSYLNRYSSHFIETRSFSVDTSGSTTLITLSQPMSMNAMKIEFTTKNVVSSTKSITLIEVYGCADLSSNAGQGNDPGLEWKIQISHNKLKSYPYLNVKSAPNNNWKCICFVIKFLYSKRYVNFLHAQSSFAHFESEIQTNNIF